MVCQSRDVELAVSSWKCPSGVLIRIRWIVVYLIDPLLLSVPSMFLTGRGCTKFRSVSLLLVAKS
jgi:hypothetical protein